MRFAILLLAATAGAPYVDELTKWRAAYEAKLKSPTGWLSVAGLFWLHEGVNAVVLPAGATNRAGVLRLQGGHVTFEPAGNGKPIGPLKPDTSDHPDTLHIGDVTLTIIERGGKLGVRMR